MKQTAVEYLHSEFKRILGDILVMPSQGMELADSISQAKEMEKQQMKDAVLSQCTTHEGFRKIFEIQFEEYYNEAFKNK